MTDRLRVVHFAFSDSLPGACSATYRMHRALLDADVDSLLLVARKDSDDSTVLGPHSPSATRRAELANLLEWKAQQWGYGSGREVSPSLFGSGLVRRISGLAPDVVNLHWINGGLVRPAGLRHVAGLPVVWTLWDMWPFLGAEHYAGGSDWYHEPASRERGVDALLWQRKRRAVRRLSRLTIACPSRWMADAARRSAMLGDREVQVIPTGIDLDRFAPGSRTAARISLGLPLDGPVVLFGAMRATQNTRKGWQLLGPALSRLAATAGADTRPTVAVFGSDVVDGVPPELRAQALGTITDERVMAEVYRAADVFIAPSTEENLANTVLESLACGTPVVAFDIGGMPDMIEHRGNGYLARPLDAVDLADGIAWVLSRSPEEASALRDRSRATAVGTFDIRASTRQYVDVYRRSAATHGAGRAADA